MDERQRRLEGGRERVEHLRGFGAKPEVYIVLPLSLGVLESTENDVAVSCIELAVLRLLHWRWLELLDSPDLNSSAKEVH